MNDTQPAASAPVHDIPPAPPDLWQRKREPGRLLALRWLALALMIAAVATGHPALVLPAALAFAVQASTNLARRTLYLRNLYAAPCLRAEYPLANISTEQLPGVTMIAPARNEEDAIEDAARSVAALDYPRLEAVFVNDHSTDRTGTILDRVAQECPRLRVIHNPPLHEGWLGKANAVWQAVLASDPSNQWLALTDADVMFHPLALRRAVECAVGNNLDFLTCVVYLDNRSLAEELYMPATWSALIQGAHYGKLNDPKTAPIGIGAFILVKRELYLNCGGHAAIRNRQPEDTLLAALIRRHGGIMGVCWTNRLIRVRIYRGYHQLRKFIVRKIRTQIEDRPLRLLHRGVYVLIQDVLPLPIAAYAAAVQLARGDFDLWLTLLAFAALGSYLTNVWSFEKLRRIAWFRRGLEWFHPLTGLLRLSFFAEAAAKIVSGKKMHWRGREFSVK